MKWIDLCIFSAMNRLVKFSFFAFLLIGFFSCKNKQEEVAKVVNKSEFRTEQKHPQAESIIANAAQKIEDWQEYRAVKEFLNQYQSISPSEALNNSRELNSLVASLRDSVSPGFLVSDSFKARVNLLYNETLRLNDMSAISSIKFEEVNEQVSKVMHAYSAMNSKINTIVRQAELDAQVNDPKYGIRMRDSLTIDNFETLEANRSDKIKKNPKQETYEDQQRRLLEQRRAFQKRSPKKKAGNPKKLESTQKLPIHKLNDLQIQKKQATPKKVPVKKSKPKKKKDN